MSKAYPISSQSDPGASASEAALVDVNKTLRAQIEARTAERNLVAKIVESTDVLTAELEFDEPSRTIVLSCNLTEPICFDETRLAQLVSNLLGNALTHGDPTQPVRLDAATDRGQLSLSVANAGEPISAAAMERLFQPFFRGEVR